MWFKNNYLFFFFLCFKHSNIMWMLFFRKWGARTLVDKSFVEDILVRKFSWMGIMNNTQIKTKTKLSKFPIKISILPLSNEVFDYLHKQVDVFLQVCINNVWQMKSLEHSPLSILTTYFKQKIWIMLQKLQPSTILSWALLMRSTTSQFPLLTNPLPITI